MPDTLLITGGSGYLGSHLARQAAAAWQVVATHFSRPVDRPGGRTEALDLRDRDAVAAFVTRHNPRTIIHTASDMSSPGTMQAVIVEGTRHLAAAAAATGAHLIHLSSDMVFDGEHAPYGEADQIQPVTPYGQAKAEAEGIVAALCPTAAIVRTSLIYGFDPLDPRSRWVLDSIRHAQPITLFSDEYRCPIWVEQLAAALLELLASGGGGVWHLAGPQRLSRHQFGERMALTYGLDPAGLTCGLSRESGLMRPRDLALDIRKAQAHLQSPVWGVDQVLARYGSSPLRTGCSSGPIDR